jgi:hypothetical protein
MPAVANPITFSPGSRSYGYNPITFKDLPTKGGVSPYSIKKRGLPTKGIPSYGYKVGAGVPFRPGVGLTSGDSQTISSGYTIPRYNVMENTGLSEYGSYDMPGTGDQIAEMLKGTIGQGLAMGGIGTLGAALTGRNLTGLNLGSTPILGELPGIGKALKWVDWKMDPSWSTANALTDHGGNWWNMRDAAGLMARQQPELFANTFISPGMDVGLNIAQSVGNPLLGIPMLAANLLGWSGFDQYSQLANNLSKQGMFPTGASGAGVGGVGWSGMYTGADGQLYSAWGDQAKQVGNFLLDKSNDWFGTGFKPWERVPYADEKLLKSMGKESAFDSARNIKQGGIGGFFNNPRSWLTGTDQVGLFGTPGVAGSGIASVGNVLGTIGGVLSLADFIDDPSLASGLGTLAGAGASGISAFSGLATAAPWLAGAALVAALLMNKKPSNKTGYTSIDLDEFKPLSFGMQGKKYSKENVDQTMQIMEPIIPLIQQLEQQYGVDLKGDIQINYGGRDGLAYNIGNRDVTGFLNRLDYFDGSDQSTRDGGSIFRKTFKGENAGKDFYKSLLGDLETLAKQKQAQGGGIIDLANYRGVQRQTPQGAFSYGLPGNVTANIAGGSPVTTGGTPATAKPRPNTGPEGVFSWGYDDTGT